MKCVATSIRPLLFVWKRTLLEEMTVMTEALDELDRPNLTLDELWEWLYYDNDLPVTMRQLRYAVLGGEIVPTKLSNRNYYTKRQGLDWIAAQRGKYRSQSKHAGD
jgi:hypothetical protein